MDELSETGVLARAWPAVSLREALAVCSVVSVSRGATEAAGVSANMMLRFACGSLQLRSPFREREVASRRRVGCSPMKMACSSVNCASEMSPCPDGHIRQRAAARVGAAQSCSSRYRHHYLSLLFRRPVVRHFSAKSAEEAGALKLSEIDSVAPGV
jgi:hypothetical protein